MDIQIIGHIKASLQVFNGASVTISKESQDFLAGVDERKAAQRAEKERHISGMSHETAKLAMLSSINALDAAS